MKILTKKKQEKILELLVESGTVISVDGSVSVNTYNKCNDVNYDIANLVGGFDMAVRYYGFIKRVLQNEIAKKGGK